MKALPSTKERFALALMELLESNSFERISVGDIVGLLAAGRFTITFGIKTSCLPISIG